MGAVRNSADRGLSGRSRGAGTGAPESSVVICEKPGFDRSQKERNEERMQNPSVASFAFVYSGMICAGMAVRAPEGHFVMAAN